MDAKKLIALVERPITLQLHRDWQVAVRVFSPGSVGGTPCAPVTSVDAGIDWDAGKILLSTDAPLTRLSQEDVLAIRTSASKGQSWHAYQSYQKQQKRIEELERQVEELKRGR